MGFLETLRRAKEVEVQQRPGGEVELRHVWMPYNPHHHHPVNPTEETTFTLYGLTSFQVQYWDGAAWVTLPGGSVTDNDRVLRKFTFPAVTTSKIKVLVHATKDSYSRIMEVEAWTQ